MEPLLRPVGRTVAARPTARERGYLDLLGPAEAAVTGATQRLMLTTAVPFVYERWCARRSGGSPRACAG